MKTTRNFVFLTITFAVLAALQFPQRELAHTLDGGIANLEANATDLTNDPITAKPATEEKASSKNQPLNNKENIKAKNAAVNKSAAVFTGASAKNGVYSATAYALRGRTASGSGVRRGIIAADPRHLPLGTRVQLTAGAWTGIYTVADTGGAIKGRKIDVWVPNNSEAMRFGRRTVQLTVLSKK